MTSAASSGGTPPEPPRPELRASDADRERVAEVLREALAEGRLEMAEFEQRLDTVYAARTYGELEPVTRDLPGHAPGGAPAPAGAGGAVSWSRRIGGTPTSRTGVGLLGGFERKGPWTAPRLFTAFAFWGGGEVDLREARFEGPEVVVRCFAVMGGVNVVVPPEVELDVRGLGFMGGFDHGPAGAGEPGAPRVVVTGLAFWGGVSVQRKHPRAVLRRLKAERKERKRLEKERRALERRPEGPQDG